MDGTAPQEQQLPPELVAGIVSGESPATKPAAAAPAQPHRRQTRLDQFMCQNLGTGEFADDSLCCLLDTSYARQQSPHQFLVQTKKGKKIACGTLLDGQNHPVLNEDKKPIEYIGLKKGFFTTPPMQPEDAEAIAALAKAKGWTSVKVFGSPEQMKMLAEAARQAGIEVVNYGPPAQKKPAETTPEAATQTASAATPAPVAATPAPVETAPVAATHAPRAAAPRGPGGR